MVRTRASAFGGQTVSKSFDFDGKISYIIRYNPPTACRGYRGREAKAKRPLACSMVLLCPAPSLVGDATINGFGRVI
jgi:hypothetical protein